MTLASLTSGSATDKLESAAAQARERQVIDVSYSYVRYNPATGFKSHSMKRGSGSVAVNFKSWLSGAADLGGYGRYSRPAGSGSSVLNVSLWAAHLSQSGRDVLRLSHRSLWVWRTRGAIISAPTAARLHLLQRLAADSTGAFRIAAERLPSPRLVLIVPYVELRPHTTREPALDSA